MTARFVPVPAAAIRDRLAGAGFKLNTELKFGEEVYDRAHDRDPRYVVRVYTSIQVGTEGVRNRGSDAIRVVALFCDAQHHWPARVMPIFKATRVHRSGTVETVLDRIVDRAREAYGACNAHRTRSATSGDPNGSDRWSVR